MLDALWTLYKKGDWSAKFAILDLLEEQDRLTERYLVQKNVAVFTHAIFVPKLKNDFLSIKFSEENSDEELKFTIKEELQILAKIIFTKIPVTWEFICQKTNFINNSPYPDQLCQSIKDTAEFQLLERMSLPIFSVELLDSARPSYYDSCKIDGFGNFTWDGNNSKTIRSLAEKAIFEGEDHVMYENRRITLFLSRYF